MQSSESNPHAMLLREGNPDNDYFTYRLDRFSGFTRMILYYIVACWLLSLFSEVIVPVSNLFRGGCHADQANIMNMLQSNVADSGSFAHDNRFTVFFDSSSGGEYKGATKTMVQKIHQGPMEGIDNWFYARVRNHGSSFAQHFMVTVTVKP